MDESFPKRSEVYSHRKQRIEEKNKKLFREMKIMKVFNQYSLHMIIENMKNMKNTKGELPMEFLLVEVLRDLETLALKYTTTGNLDTVVAFVKELVANLANVLAK